MNVYLKKITLASVLSAFSIIAFLIEGLFPPLIIPGARMGISNIFILFAVLILGFQYGYIILIVKIILGSLFSGNISAVIYSLPAGVVSLSIEILLIYFTKKVSIIATSIVGATINILLQNLTFCIVTTNIEYIIYSPYLALLGVLAGFIVGLAVYFIIKIIPINLIKKLQIYDGGKDS